MSAFPAGDAPRISVVVATYNYDLYLARALDSILAQQEVDFEVLVVDDGSTDQTREIVGRYGRAVNYVRQEHAGVSARAERAPGPRAAATFFLSTPMIACALGRSRRCTPLQKEIRTFS